MGSRKPIPYGARARSPTVRGDSQRFRPGARSGRGAAAPPAVLSRRLAWAQGGRSDPASLRCLSRAPLSQSPWRERPAGNRARAPRASSRQRRCSNSLPIGSSHAPTSCLCTGRNGSDHSRFRWSSVAGAPRTGARALALERMRAPAAGCPSARQFPWPAGRAPCLWRGTGRGVSARPRPTLARAHASAVSRAWLCGCRC